MTAFENFLISKGYIRFKIEHNPLRYEIPKYHTFSTMGDLDYRYFHKDDPIIEKIKKKIPISFEDRKGEIIYGLNEYKKPPTLVYPRPIIMQNGWVTTPTSDDDMNKALQQFSFDEIFEAMYDSTITLKLKEIEDYKVENISTIYPHKKN